MKQFQLKKLATAFIMVLIFVITSCKDDKIVNDAKISAKGATNQLKAQLLTSSYSIPAGSIVDHSDATIPGSIAWYLATYGGGTATSPNTFWLTSNALYTCQKTITLPAYARISEGAGVTDAVIQCDPVNWQSAAGYNKLVTMNKGSILLHVELRLNWKGAIGAFASSADSIQIIDVTIQNSAKIDGSYLIYVSECNNILIDNCLLRRAGCDVNETNFARHGYLIHMIRGNNNTISNNDMAVCGSSGIGFVQSTNVHIDNNFIHDTGRALIADYISDGITSYHGGDGTLNRCVFITNNTIDQSRNHAIHVSGYGMSITGNTITNSTQSNIYVGDQRTPQDCSADYWITGNSFGSQGAVYSIYRNPVISSRIHIYTNTGSISVQPAIECQ